MFYIIVLYKNTYNCNPYYLEPLYRNANSEEDTDSQTDVTATLGYRVDDGEDMVISAKSNGNDKEVTEEKNEVGYAKTSKEVIEDVVHGPENEDNTKDDSDVLSYPVPPSAKNQ